MPKEISYQDKPWVAYYEKDVPEFVGYEDTCIPGFLDRAAQRFPNRMALSFQGYEVTYQGLKNLVERFAACLFDFGIKKGDSVAILLPNLIPCVVAYYAVLKVGGVVVMNNPLYSDRELEHQFIDSNAKMLITLDLLANRMIDLRKKTNIREIVYTSIGDYLPFPKNILFPLVAKKKKLAASVKPAENIYRWKELIKKYSPNPPEVKISFGDVAQYQYTGGTTGISKGVVLTHENLSKQVQQIGAWLPTLSKNHEIMLGALPFFHVFGMSVVMNFSIYVGWSDVLVPKPQPEPLLETIRKYRPTFAPLVPTMYIGMLNHKDIAKTDMTCLKGCFSGSAPLPLEVIRAFEGKTGAIIIEGYGLTETSPVTHVNPFHGKRKVGSIGVPVSDTLCRVVSLEDGKTDLPVGESGEIAISGPQVMQGYWNMSQETDAVLDDGWLLTGDIGKMDEEGYFYIVDRKKDLIISGGFNVYPRDIDEVLFEHPKIQEACAIGIPHPTRGEAVKVFVVLREGEDTTEEEIIRYCATKLARFKLPTEVEFRNELPKSNVGKVLRKELRAEEMERRGSL
ncbi:MAG: long-chain fatty acid--CoA ligase [Desulfobacterales bacterium]